MRKKFNICVIEPSGLLYGSELALLDILEKLNKDTYTVEVILPKRSPLCAKLKRLNVVAKPYIAPGHKPNIIRRLISYSFIYKYLRNRTPDVIYVNQGGVLRPMAAIARRLNAPILCQVQTLEDSRWVSGLVNTHKSVGSFVCNSLFIKAHTHVPPDRLSMVYYGYRPKGIPARKRRETREPLEVGLLGRICESKGHFLLLEMARLLRQEGSSAYHFRFIGDAPSPLERENIKRTVHNMGLDQMIEFRGFQTNIGAELQELDTMVIPSLAEPFGRIFCEAAEAKLPVIASDGGGLGELVQHFGAGLTFRTGNVTDFKNKLEVMRIDYDAYLNKCEFEATRMLKMLNLDDYITIIENLLTGVASNKPVSVSWRGNAITP